MWSWKGPLALVGLIALGYFACMFLVATAGPAPVLTWRVMVVRGYVGSLAPSMILAVVFPLALFVASGFVAFVAGKVIRRRRSK